ncbi:uncharacterized protein BCR38DRAFT_426915 [Pseudomassariella vexata]|uniref:Uncharacterized protein n=1 Tax=Pseudomassariella vexata TaxID=1141098 RepID=A0A1Y2E764_9PEZI|nr:uncharacterized protein BCR38DRAFT_426915 [Pseudomassariella vexata]ORY67392.1 hypothetical protein BCR38DRAFT_426915 [Pseudomassariella vexata]
MYHLALLLTTAAFVSASPYALPSPPRTLNARQTTTVDASQLAQVASNIQSSNAAIQVTGTDIVSQVNSLLSSGFAVDGVAGLLSNTQQDLVGLSDSLSRLAEALNSAGGSFSDAEENAAGQFGGKI